MGTIQEYSINGYYSGVYYKWVLFRSIIWVPLNNIGPE